MKKPFAGNFPQTQGFGGNPEMYKKFGLLGHDGLDYGCPTNTKIIAPHDGKIIEATLDPQGYGIYVKIENSLEGSVLAHLKEYRVGIGDGVKEGELIGYSDNTGNSTGPHLHWGYYKFPRDRKNGFNGFIDQTPFLTQGGITVPVESTVFENLVRKATGWDKVCQKLNVADNEGIVFGELDKLISYEDLLVQKDKKVQEVEEKITLLQKDLKELSDRYSVAEEKVATMTQKVEEQAKTIDNATQDLKEAQNLLQELKDQLQQPVLKGWRLFLYKLLIRGGEYV